MSKFYDIDPSDPESPRELLTFTTARGDVLRPGDRVIYDNHGLRPGWLNKLLVITEIIDFSTTEYSDHVDAVINDGEYQLNADNLRKEDNDWHRRGNSRDLS